MAPLRDAAAFESAAAQRACKDLREAQLDQRARALPPDGTSFRHINAMRRPPRRRAALRYPFSRSLKLQGLRLPSADGADRA
eukprot:1446278-Pyramimonas_sp.AAC.1